MKKLKADLQAALKQLKALTKKVEKALTAAGTASKTAAVKKAKPAKKKAAVKKTKAVKKVAAKKPTDAARTKVLQTIKRLRKSGKSYGEITKHLDSNKIATFSGKGKWHAQTIANILKTA
jgi:hypothetical protein